MKRKAEHIFEEYLVISAQAGDGKALDRLLKRWWPKLCGYATRQLSDSELAKEAAQDTLLTVSTKLRGLTDPSSFPKWVYQILHRRCVDSIRRQQRNRKIVSAAKHEDSLGLNGANQEEGFDVSRVLSQLELSTAQILRLHYLEGFSVSELSEILAIPAGTVKSRLFTARKTIRELLEG